MDRAVILVGTETGTAEDLAEELAATLGDAGVETEVVDMEEAETDLLDGSRAVIVCTATHGDGELPDNSLDLYEKLERERPDLGGVLFCVCGLGDDAYADFCEAGRIWSRFLSELGAYEVVERYEIDGYPEEEDVRGACEWVEEAVERFEEVAAEKQRG
jgi:MioC protein